jgi:alpha/beta superfamily hydrolase
MEPAFILRRLARGGDRFHSRTRLDARMWDPQFEIFAQRFSVIRYDMRGFGRSSVPTAEGYSHAEDLHALLRFLRVQQALPSSEIGGRVYHTQTGLLQLAAFSFRTIKYWSGFAGDF